MDLQYSSDGIYIRDLDLWLDPQVSKPAAWISHAHSDHARGYSETLIGTPVSLELYRMRWPEDEGRPQRLIGLDFGQSLAWNGARLTCYPAGHILGAAQLLVEFGAERLVYSGDIKLRAPLCGAATEVVPCDRLILESTFGLPIYHFLSRDEAREEIVGFAKECLEEGATPAFLGYPLGRGQEVAYALAQAGIPLAVHGAIAKFLPNYERAGYAVPGWEALDTKQVQGKALVVVPGMRRLLEASGKDIRVAYVSGWARLDNARLRAGAEKLIPYSDHCSYAELIEMVTASGARHVDVIHGYTEAFAGILRERGIHAEAPVYARSRASEEDGVAQE
jgi:Cft2 family RNA processing exonuclease